MSTAEHLLYEFPCNEKIRTYLRLEALFQRFDWFCEQTSAIAHQAGISALFDLLDATARSDLRHELIQELERQRQRLIAKNASADPDMAAHLAEIGAAIQAVSDSVGRTTQSVRENQWLQIIRTRQSIAGGTCEFDLPQMHLWMNTAPEIRRRELQSYVSTLEPIRTGTMLLLRIFRANSHCQSLTAVNGTYPRPSRHPCRHSGSCRHHEVPKPRSHQWMHQKEPMHDLRHLTSMKLQPLL